ncbi:hypothetical protein KR009_003264 [Drosophila setifemur]|nr:hypothetical protein KR009_003264 [Drosophila setifemur]
MAGALESRVVDLGAACLVCLTEEPGGSCSIYGRDLEPPHLLIVDKIRSCTSLQLGGGETSTWPDKICRQCHNELTVAYRFREKCVAVEKLLLQEQQQQQLKLDLELHQVRLPATLQIKRVDLDTEPGSTSLATAPAGSGFYRDEHDDDDLTLLPDAAGTLVLSLNSPLEETDPIKEQPSDGEEDKLLTMAPWDEDDQTPEHLYEIETQLESMVGSPTLPPPPPPPPPAPPSASIQLRKRTYRRVTPVLKEEGEEFLPSGTASGGSSTKRRHTERSPKICDVCGNTYKYQHALNAHMRRHNNERPYPCEVCQKAFISNVELRRHMRVHTGQKPYSCRFCERRFSDFGSSKKHERIHTGERPYVCEVCQKGFAYAHVLSVHRRTHTGKKQFQCSHCDKGFTKKSYLAAHMELHRGGASASGSGSGSGSAGNVTKMEIASNLRLPARKETFTLDSIVLGDQTKVLEECIVTNDFMFNDEEVEEKDDDDDNNNDDEEEEKDEVGPRGEHVEDAVTQDVDGRNGQATLEHHEPYTAHDFDDVDGYEVKELVGDLLDAEEFVEESKFLID